MRDIYSDTSISPLIGFKGGTCAFLFYGLTRFSVDLDFDLFKNDESTQQMIYEKIGAMVRAYGEIKDQFIKQNTAFFLLSYGDSDHNIKIEINTRVLAAKIKEHYELTNYLGITIPIGKKDYLFASKLAALTDRKTIAIRDIYDIWFFAKNNWDINLAFLQARTGKTISEHIDDCIHLIESVKDNEILQGLAELLPDEKTKAWVKTHLRQDAIFLLKNYQSVLGRSLK